MNSSLDKRRIGIFLLLAFGIAWIIGLIIFLNGGLYSSLIVPALGGQPFALLLFDFGYLFAPLLANLLTRLLTQEGWNASYLRSQIQQGWRFWVAAWVLPIVFTILGAGFFFLFFPNFFDSSFSKVYTALAQNGQTAPINPWTFLLIDIFWTMAVSPLLLAVFTFGEEFGWRGYLLPKLLPLGAQRAALISGVIWGVWYWPILAMGYEYGLSYPGFPWLGMIAFLLFSTSTGVFLAWVMVRSESIWPAVIGRAAINGTATISLLVLQGKPNPILGPFPTGVIGVLGWMIIAAVLLIMPRFWSAKEAATESRVIVPQ